MLKRFSIKDADFGKAPKQLKNLPQFFSGTWYGRILSQLRDDHDLVPEITSLAKGSTAVERLPDIMGSLLPYSQAFERYEPFKKGRLYQSISYEEQNNFEMERFKYTDGEMVFMRHPVERAICEATRAAEENHERNFKVHRPRTFEYLEFQYERIVLAHRALSEYIREKRRVFGQLRPALPEEDNSWRRGLASRSATAEALGHVENYAKAYFSVICLRIFKIISRNAAKVLGAMLHFEDGFQ